MPVYLFWGDEEYLLEEELNKLKKTLLCGDVNALNYMKYDNPDIKTLEGILRSNSMLFGNVLHVVKAQKYFLSGKNGTGDENRVENIIKDIEYVGNSVHVVFVCPIERGERKKPDQRKKIYKTVAKFGTVKEFTAFKDYEHWKYIPVIQTMTKKKDIEISNETVMFLVETSGVYLMDIDSQLEKLKLCAYPNKKITPEMIKEISIVNEDVFKLIDLVLANKPEHFLNKISNLLEKSHYLEILALLQTMFLKILQTKMYSINNSKSEIARILGQNERIVEINLEKVANIPLRKLVQIKQNLTVVEYKLKIGEISDPILAFEQVVLGGVL